MNDVDFAEVLKAASNMDGYHLPWAVCGGWAVDLFLNRSTRLHKDADFAVLRGDQLVLQEHLATRGWALEKAVQGQLIPWKTNEWIDLPTHVIWCKNPEASPDFIEILFNEVEGVNFLFRRDPSIILPFEKMILHSASGLPILAPEIILLYKSGNPEDPSAASDFRNVSPRLSLGSRAWLSTALKKSNPDHIWLKDLL